MVATKTFQSILGKSGGTTFHFVTEGIHAALDRARDAAKGKDVRLGSGENLFTDIEMLALDYECSERVATASAMHLLPTKR